MRAIIFIIVGSIYACGGSAETSTPPQCHTEVVTVCCDAGTCCERQTVTVCGEGEVDHVDAADEQAPPDASEAAPDAAPDVVCASCCRVPAGMVTCPADFGCGACCSYLEDGGANPRCPQ